MSSFRLLFVLCLSAFLLMTGVGMIVALLPQRMYAATASMESVGLTASVFAVAYLLAQPLIGALSDRFGAKPFLVAGYALCCGAGIAFAQGSQAAAILLGRAIQGAGEAPIWALGPAILAEAYPAAKGRAIGRYNAAIHAGLMIGPGVGLLLPGDGALPFLAFAALALAGGLAALLLPSPAIAAAPRSGPRLGDLGTLLERPGIAAALGGVVLYGGCYGVFVSVLPVSLILSNGAPAEAASGVFTLFYGAIGLAQWTIGPLCDRFGRVGFMRGGMALAAAGFAVFPLIPGAAALLPLAAASLGLGAFCVASLAALSDMAPQGRAATVAGAYYLAWGLGYVLGPLALGWAEAAAPGVGYLSLAAAGALFAARPARR